MKRLIRLTTLVLALALLATALPLAALADSLYIIPDSDRRQLTRDELWGYQYDTLLYAFNEIYARHGYKFKTGSRCYNWFSQMPWYHANESESETNHSESFNACSALENANRDLIVAVRKEMRELGTTNPSGKGMPTPPRNVNKPRGFEYVDLKAGQKLAVYSAPSTAAYRANNGKAAVSTNGAVYALGYDGNWMLMLYEANNARQYRVGYVDVSQIKGKTPALGQVAWAGITGTLQSSTTLTDDPALTGAVMANLPAGTTVTFLTTMFNDRSWDYVETSINGQVARGFIPTGVLDLTSYDADMDLGQG